MPKQRKGLTKPANELQPGEFVDVGHYWMKVGSIEPGRMSKYQPEKQLLIIRGWVQPWGEAVRAGEFTEPVVNDYLYTDSVVRYLPADLPKTESEEKQP